MKEKITVRKCRKIRRADGLRMRNVMEYTFPALLEAISSRYGSRRCYSVFHSDVSYTYSMLKECAESVSSYLIRSGICKGDRIAIIGESSPMWMIMYLGIVSIGAIAVPILPDFPECDVQTILEFSGAKGAAVSRKCMDKAAGAAVPHLFRLDDLTEIVPGETDGIPLIGCSIDEEMLERRRPSEEDTASLIFTSGTTGSAKGVMLSHMNILRCADLATDQYVRLKPGMKALSILPMSHTYEFTLGQIVPLMTGMEIVFLGKAPAPTIIMAAFSEVRPHVVFSVPLLMEKVCRSVLFPRINESRLLSSLMSNPVSRPLACRLIGHALRKKFGGRLIFFGIGGAALDRETEEFLHDIRFPYAIGYGLTETSPLIAGCKPRHRSQKPGSAGPVVLDDDVVLLNRNEEGIGEIAVKGPNVMQGYYKRPDLNEEVFTEDGYFRTGDLGSIDERGNLAIRGRSKTMILGPSGENIFPEAIESIINNQAYVDESLVIPENGGLVALVRLNFDKMQEALNMPMDELRKAAVDYLREMKKEVNSKLSSFSKLTGIREQKTPFERTPTLKIKRFLYDGSRKTPAFTMT